MAKTLILLTTSALLAGCVLEEAGGPVEDEIGEEQAALSMGIPAVMSNAVMSNAVMSNAVMSNALVTVALDTWALDDSLQAEMDNATSRTVMKYVVECALATGDSVTLRDSSGHAYTMRGRVGLATGWKSGACDTMCMRDISSCLLARANAKGIQVRISVRQPANDDGPLSVQSSKELATYTKREASYYGSLFGPATARKAFVANSLNVALSTVKTRMCDGGGYTIDSCPIFFTGTNEDTGCFFKDACRSIDPTNAAPDTCYALNICDYPTPPAGTTYTRPLTVYRADADCSHGEHQTGVPLSSSCSPCAWRVINELGHFECSTSSKASSWSSTCARAAIDSCGDHSLCSVGTPLVMGDSACIDRVCQADESCCLASGSWSSRCIGEAESLCGITCP